MKRITICLAALLALGTFTLSPVDAQISAVPQTINFQGGLANPSGNPVLDGTYSIRFSLWNVASGGTAAANEKWNQTITTVAVRNGRFAVPLNVSTGTADKFNGNLWLEIKVGTDAALTPRTALATVPYAIKADKIVDGAITTTSIANGAVTDAKIAGMSWSKITGVPVDSLTLPFVATSSSSGSNALLSINNTGNGVSIFGDTTSGVGVYGRATNNAGVQGESTTYYGVVGYGRSGSLGGVRGVQSAGNEGILARGNGEGVSGFGVNNHGVYGYTPSSAHGGVVGDNANGDRGVLAGPGYAVAGNSIGGTGGQFGTTGTNGVDASSTGLNGNGVIGTCNNGTAAFGVFGISSSGNGVVGSGVRYGIYSYGSAGGTTGWANVSDVRYKRNIVPFENALEAILNLRGVTYEYRRDEFKGMNFPKGTQIGFIAQEIEKILPQVVMTDENGYKSVTYANVVPVLVEAVKTLNARTVLQQKQNTTLKKENDTLKETLAEVMKRLDALESSRK